MTRRSSLHMAEQTARLDESATRSREMGSKVERIRATTDHTDTLVEDIHNHLIGREGTD